MTKKISEKFKKLDEVSHVLLRPGRYVRSITPHSEKMYMYDESNQNMIEEDITYTPALLKIFDEIISNSADFSKTQDGKHLTEIKVNANILTGEISVYDNGGIHVIKHSDTKQWIPEMIFELRSGSNFNDAELDADNDFNTGQNGEGAALTSIFSTSFKVETADGKNKFIQIHSNNSREKTEPKLSKSTKQYTEITFVPDYTKFGIFGLDIDNYKMLQKRTVDIAGCNPHLKVYFNDKLIKINTFKDYISLYTDSYIFEENENWKVGLSVSNTGFKHISFVNSTSTKLGGNHIDYISNQIVTKLRQHFKSKHKIDIKPSDIKNHFCLFIDAKIKKPRYDSQTKDNLITEIKNFGTEIVISDCFIKILLKSEIIQSILDWVSAKEKAQLMSDLRKANKAVDKNNPKSVDKFHDCSIKDRSKSMLLIGEGDSALSAILSGRDPKTMAAFPLRGKPINVTPMELKDIFENKEFKNIMTITGLQFGVKVQSIEDLRFGKLVIATDSDLDGYNIRGLLFNAFYKFWPELFDLNCIWVLNTPIVKVKYKKSTLNFYDLNEFEVWKKEHINEKFESKYYKGLGTSSSKEWKEYLSDLDKHLTCIKLDELSKSLFELQFSKESGMSDKRKNWLNIET